MASVKQTISVHLDDYVILVHYLLRTLGSSGEGEGEVTYQKALDQLLQKDTFLQEAVNQLAVHQRRQKQIESVKGEIAELDATIVEFAGKLSEMEQVLYEATTDHKTLKNLDGIVTKQSFPTETLLKYSEKLALMSVAPASFQPGQGLSLAHPPIVSESLMGASRLHRSVEELLVESSAASQTRLAEESAADEKLTREREQREMRERAVIGDNQQNGVAQQVTPNRTVPESEPDTLKAVEPVEVYPEEGLPDLPSVSPDINVPVPMEMSPRKKEIPERPKPAGFKLGFDDSDEDSSESD
eukprot:142047_1